MNKTVSERVLLVEDDEQLGRQIVGHLAGDGFEVDWLRDGDDAMLADPQSYGLIVLDLMLPGAYGLDVLKRVRGDSDVPVLILHGRRDEVVPVAHAHKLDDAAVDSALHLYDAGHNDGLDTAPGYWQNIRMFLEASDVLP